MCWSAGTHSGALLAALVVGLLASGCGGSPISEEAAARFAARKTPFPVTVFPINVIRGDRLEYDADLARYLAEVLIEEQIAVPRLSPTPAPVAVHPGVNRSRSYRRSARAFCDYLRTVDPGSDYALLVEILTDRDETRVIAVHYYLADRQGRLADGAAWDFHHPLFRAVDPRDRATGLQVLIGELRMRSEAAHDSLAVGSGSMQHGM